MPSSTPGPNEEVTLGVISAAAEGCQNLILRMQFLTTEMTKGNMGLKTSCYLCHTITPTTKTPKSIPLAAISGSFYGTDEGTDP